MADLWGAILAAGRGTRLRPLTHHLPKPLVPLAGRPLLSYALDALARLEVDAVGINAYHLADAVPAGLADRPERLAFVFEQTLQGTGGGIRGIAADLARLGSARTLVVVNGDALFDFDLAPLVAEHRARGAMATLVLRAVPPDSPFAKVGVDAEGRLHRIAEIAGPDAERVGPLRMAAYTGVQIIEPALVAAIPDGPCDILRSAYKARIAERAPLFGGFAPDGGVWLDVGTPERYRAAHAAFLDGRLPAPHLPPADAEGRRVDPAAEVHPTARLIGPCAVLAGARVGARATVGPGVFVDRGAVVAAAATVRDAVIWPRARAEGSVAGAVVLPDEG